MYSTGPPCPAAGKSPAAPSRRPTAAETEKGWYDKAEIAAIFAVSVQHFDRSIRKLAGPEATKRAGSARHRGKLLFHARSLIDAWTRDQASTTAPAAPAAPPPDDWLMTVGPDTPAIEEFRRVRTAQEKIKLALMDGSSIPKAEIQPALLQFAGLLRQAGETLQRQFGDEAAAVLNEAVNEAVKGWEELLAAGPLPTLFQRSPPVPANDKEET